MKPIRSVWIFYFFVSIVLAVALLYPTLIYYDLSGMGGYDGFASPTFMAENSTWATAESTHTSMYYLFQTLSVLWLISLINAFIGIVILVKNLVRWKGKTAQSL